MTIQDVQLTEEEFLNLFTWFRALPGQVAGLRKLRAHINQSDPCLLTKGAEWLQDYRNNPTPRPNPIKVPYEYQLDNVSGEGYRECFSSTCAMLARHLGKVSSDDEYNRIRSKFGDTTSAEAQLSALRSLGLKANFYTSGHPVNLMTLISTGQPVAVGWLHRGHVSSPSGGGHWTLLVGYADMADGLPRTWIHHDPNGEADLVNGGYVNNSAAAGAFVKYSAKNWEKRWMPGGTGGWYLTCSP